MHIHIISIAGSMTAPIAKALKLQGNKVTGSDQERIYPPISNILKEADIEINNTIIDKNIDLVIVGGSYNSFEKTRNEFETVKKLKIPYLSAAQYVAQYLAKENSILIAGSFGKTTITSLLAWIFSKANFNPNYMFGGKLINKFDSTKITSSDWSIIEADESIHGLETKAKFLYYPVKHLILTSADWEHQDCYKTEDDNYQAFKKLIERIPKNGTLLINNNGYKTKDLSKFAKSKVITYNSSDSDYSISKIDIQENQTELQIKTPKKTIKVITQLLGNFNFENILAAVALSDYLEVDTQIIQKAISSFKGVERRIELIANQNNVLFFDDFAQSAPRIKSTIEALKTHYPNRKIKAFYLPHASFLQYKNSLKGLKSAFEKADQVILGKIKFNPSLDKSQRATASDFRQEIGEKLIYIPLEQDIIDYFNTNLKDRDIVIYMSSGSLEGHKIIKSIIKNRK